MFSFSTNISGCYSVAAHAWQGESRLNRKRKKPAPAVAQVGTGPYGQKQSLEPGDNNRQARSAQACLVPSQYSTVPVRTSRTEWQGAGQSPQDFAAPKSLRTRN